MTDTFAAGAIDQGTEKRVYARPVLRVRLLGELQATWKGTPVRPESRGAVRLLAVLATQLRPRSRADIAADLWPEDGPSVGRWLRQALWHLRKAFAAAGADPEEVFEPATDRLGFRIGLAVDVDARRFAALLAGEPRDLDAALAMYDGDFGEGLDLECFAREREHLSDLYEDALAELGRRRLREGDLESAHDAARGLLERDPLREEAHSTLIEVFGLSGSRDQVIRQYRRLERMLDDELGVQPLAETQKSFQTAMRRTAERSARAVAGEATDGRRAAGAGMRSPSEVLRATCRPKSAA